MKDKAFIGTSLLAAAAASLCCTLPLIAAIAGISVAGVAGFFAAWRPYLLAATAVLLVSGFYFSYRKPKQVLCVPGAACELTRAGRYSRLGLWLATAFVILFAAFPYYAPAVSRLLFPVSQANIASTATVRHLSLTVQGMTCPVCAQGIEHRLNAIAGVKKAAVSYEQKTAAIDYDPRLVKLEQLEQPFHDAGFKTAKQ